MFGRVLNGVAVGSECVTAATAATASGQFVHIEQDTALRSPAQYDNWVAVLNSAFNAPL